MNWFRRRQDDFALPKVGHLSPADDNGKPYFTACDVLLIDTDPVGPCLASEDGRPVWPVHSTAQLGALRSIADVFNARLEEVRGLPSSHVPTSGEHVVVIDDGLHALGASYAGLTDREYRVERTVKGALQSADAPAVVLVHADQVDDRLLRLSTSHPSGAVIGVVPVCSRNDFEGLSLLRAAAATLRPQPPVRRVDIWLDAPGSTFGDGPVWVAFGNDASAQAIRAALSAGAGLLSVVAHSDGFDLRFGDELFVCSQIDMVEKGNEFRPKMPACRKHDFCYRVEQPLHNALGHSHLASPDIIRARTLLWLTCFGIVGHSTFTHPAWSLGRRLMESRTIGAFLTSWTLAIVRYDHLAAIADRLFTGLSIGESLRQARTETDGEVTATLCLIGDPRTTSGPDWSALVEPPLVGLNIGTNSHVRLRTPEACSVVSPYGLRLAEMSAKQTLEAPWPVYRPIRHRREETTRRAARRVLTTIDQWDGKRRSNDGGLRLLMSAIAEHACLRSVPAWINDWTTTAVLDSRGTDVRCRCGAVAEAFDADVGASGTRSVRICPGCGRIEDFATSVEPHFEMRPERRSFELENWSPRGHWTGWVQVISQAERRRVFREWPRIADAPAPRLPLLSTGNPTGPVYIVGAFVERRGVSLVQLSKRL